MIVGLDHQLIRRGPAQNSGGGGEQPCVAF
jgi:hypothetical protein